MTHSLREEIERIAASTGVYEQESLKDELRALVRLMGEECARICEDNELCKAARIRAFAAQLTPGQEPVSASAGVDTLQPDSPALGSPNAQTETPRTDAVMADVRSFFDPYRKVDTKLLNLALTLERELAACKANAQTERRKGQRRWQSIYAYLTLMRREATTDRRKANAQAPSPRGE